MEKISIPDIATRPLVFDTSKHNGKLTAAQILSTKCVLVIIRTGISYRYVDPLFEYYRGVCESIHIPWSGYHVLYPSQPGWPQAENAKAIIGDNPGVTSVPVWNDLELAQGVSATQMADCCQEFGDEIHKAFGGEKGTYSRATFLNEFMPSYMPGQQWQQDYLWWLAQVKYGNVFHPGPYNVPTGLDSNRIVMIQNDWKGQIAGHTGDVDFSRWIRSIEELNKFLGITPEPEPDVHDLAWLKKIHENPELHP